MRNTILFDLDGTLVPYFQEDFINAYIGTLVKLLTPMGYDSEKIVAALWKGTGAMLTHDGQRTNRQVFWESFAADLGYGALGLESILDGYYSNEFNAVSATLKETVDRGGLIHALREKGYALVLATNPVFPAVAVASRLRWIGLEPEDFDYVTTYENSRFSKPDPAYYQEILTKLGRQGDQCLMVGNNPSDDGGAEKAGIPTWLVTDYLENEKGLPLEGFTHFTFRELEQALLELPDIH